MNRTACAHPLSMKEQHFGLSFYDEFNKKMQFFSTSPCEYVRQLCLRVCF